jgi:hypothetical protein
MARKERKYHYIYKITCLRNNRYYIGMHSTDDLEDGYMGGGKRIKNSVKKHGKDAHRKEILEFFENREDLKNREIQLVNEELLSDPMCMNLQPGGGGGIINADHLERMKEGASDFAIKQWKNEEFREKTTMLLVEYVKENHKKGLYKYGKFKGKSHSEEAKRSIGEKNSNKQTGEKNSQYGTNWITNGIDNKKIHKDNQIPDGWKLGRISKNK